MGLFDKLAKGAAFLNPLVGVQIAGGRRIAGDKAGALSTLKAAGGGAVAGAGAGLTLTGNPALGLPLVGSGVKTGVGAMGASSTSRSNAERIAQQVKDRAASGGAGAKGGAGWIGGTSTGGGSSALTVPMPTEGGYGGYGSVMGMQDRSSYTDPNQKTLDMYTKPSPDEVRHAGNVDNLARMIGDQGGSLYNISNPTYASALKYYGDILSGSKSAVTQAIAPEAEMLAEMTAAEQKAITQGGARGGARDTALAEAGREGAGAISRLIPQARKDAAAAGSQIALQGMGLGSQQQATGASLYDQLRGAEQQNRQFGIQAEMQNRFQAAGIDAQWAQTALQEKLGMRGLDLEQMSLALNEKLGMRGLDIQEMLGMNSLQLQRELGLAGINLNQQEIDLMKQQMKDEAARNKGKMVGDLGGIIVQTLPLILDKKKGGSLRSGPSDPFGGYGGLA